VQQDLLGPASSSPGAPADRTRLRCAARLGSGAVPGAERHGGAAAPERNVTFCRSSCCLFPVPGQNEHLPGSETGL